MNRNQQPYIDMMVPDQQPLAVPQMMRNDRADLLDKIKPDVIIERIRHRLLGEEEDGGVWHQIPELKNRALTPVGAWEITNLMLGFANINTSISKLEDFEIKRRLFRLASTAQSMCIANWRAYGIKNASQLEFVDAIVFTSALVVLKQADNASIQELLKGTVTENRNVNSEPRKDPWLKRVIGL